MTDGLKAAQRAPSESIDRSFRRLIEDAPDAIAVHGDGRFLYANGACARLLGFAHGGELVGRLVIDFVHPEDRALVRHRLARIVAGESLPPAREHFLRADGRSVSVLVSSSVTTFEGVPAVQSFARDIASQMRIEDALRSNSDKLLALIDTQSEIAGSELDVESVMRRIVARIRELVAADGVAIAMLEDDTLVFRSAAGIGDGHIPYRTSLSGLAGAAIESGTVMRCDDAANDPLIDSEQAAEIGVVSTVVVPLIYGARTLGAVVVASRRAHAFRDDQVEMLRLLAGVLSSALSHALDFEERRAMLAERTRALEQLRLSEHRFRAQFQAIPVPTFSWRRRDDGEFELADFNDAARTTTHGRIERLLGVTANELYRDQPEIARTIENVARDGHQVVDEMEYRLRSTGERRDLIVTYAFVPPDLVLVHTVDVTQRRMAERALQASEILFKTAFLASPVAIALSSPDGRIQRVNDAFCTLLGCPAEWAVDRDIASFVHPDDRPAFDAAIREIGATGPRPIHLEQRYVRRDAVDIWGFVDIALVVDAERHPVYFVTQIVDATERKLAEQTLRESERRYRTLLEQASDAIAVADADTGAFLTVNQAACELLGYTREELTTMRIADILLPEDIDSGAERMRALRAGASLLSERRLRRRDGALVAVEISTRLVGSTLQAFIRDITERQRLEAQLRQSQKMDAVGRLAAGIAHDFNNLLTVITTCTDLALADMPSGLAVRDDIREIKVAAGRATDLTRQLLAFGRQQVLRPELLNLNRVIDEAERMLRRLVPENVRLVTRLEPDIGAILADDGQLTQVLMNLVINARDAMPDGGMLSISTHSIAAGMYHGRGDDALRRSGGVSLIVADTGHGMDDETRAHVFDPFFTTKDVGKGTGLGLATVYGIVEQSGGAIEVASTPGSGSTFTIVFPCAAADPGTRAAVRPVGAAGNGETVLLVEDEAMLRSAARRVLERSGYTVLTAPNGIEAARMMEGRATPPALLLTDLIMPELGGKALAERLRERWPDLRVLFMSGHSVDAVQLHGRLAAASAFIEKPFAQETLLREISALLARRP